MARSKKEICIVGHRGAAGYGFPNSKTAFEAAISFGCCRTETDVHLSSDGVVICHHDPDFTRLEHVDKKIVEMTLDEIKEITHPDGGHVLTLEEVIAICKGNITLQIELKAVGTPEAVYELLQKHGLLGDTVISSFKRELLEEMRTLDPTIRLLYLSHFPTNLPFQDLKKINVEIIGIKATKAKQEHIDAIHKQKFKAYTYGVGDERIGKKMQRFGIDTFSTDFPQVFLLDSE